MEAANGWLKVITICMDGKQSRRRLVYGILIDEISPSVQRSVTKSVEQLGRTVPIQMNQY
jgi:hypothetical protein